MSVCLCVDGCCGLMCLFVLFVMFWCDVVWFAFLRVLSVFVCVFLC